MMFAHNMCLTPGLLIPVVSSSVLKEKTPDAIVVFAWNFAREIIDRFRHVRTTWIVPLPEYVEINT